MIIDKFDGTKGWGKYYILITDWLLRYVFNLKPFNSGCPQFHLSYLALFCLPFVAIWKEIIYHPVINLIDAISNFLRKRRKARLDKIEAEMQSLPPDILLLLLDTSLDDEYYDRKVFCEPELRKYRGLKSRFDTLTDYRAYCYEKWDSYKKMDRQKFDDLKQRVINRLNAERAERQAKADKLEQIKEEKLKQQPPNPPKPPSIPLNKRPWWPKVVLWAPRIVGTLLTIIGIIVGLALLYYASLASIWTYEAVTAWFLRIDWAVTGLFWKNMGIITAIVIMLSAVLGVVAWLVIQISPFIGCGATKFFRVLIKILAIVFSPFAVSGSFLGKALLFLGKLLYQIFEFIAMAISMFYRNNCPPIIRSREDLDEWNKQHQSK